MCLGKPKSKLLVKIQIQIQFIDKDFEKGPKVISEVIKDKKRKKSIHNCMKEATHTTFEDHLVTNNYFEAKEPPNRSTFEVFIARKEIKATYFHTYFLQKFR